MINLEAGQIFDEKYQLIRMIDTGGFSEVWEAKFLTAGNTVALKIYPRLDEEGVKNLEQEYSRLFELQHSHLLNALHFGKYLGYPYLVMRYYVGGNASKRIGDMNEPEIAKCIFQIADALQYLHANDIVHQDIKPNNFLLDQKGNFYLGDLGLSLKLRNTITRQTQAHSEAGRAGSTPAAYRAPELWENQDGKIPLKETDIWAFGASLYELITGSAPFGDLGGFFEKNKREIDPLPVAFSNQLFVIINNCLEIEPAKRPSALQLKNFADNYLQKNKWFNDSNDKTKQSKTNNISGDTVYISPSSNDITSANKKKKSKLLPATLVSIFVVFITILIAKITNQHSYSDPSPTSYYADTPTNPSQNDSAIIKDTVQKVLPEEGVIHKWTYYKTTFYSTHVSYTHIAFDPWSYDLTELQDSLRNLAFMVRDENDTFLIRRDNDYAFTKRSDSFTTDWWIDTATISYPGLVEKFKANFVGITDEVFIDFDQKKLYLFEPGLSNGKEMLYIYPVTFD